MGFLDDEPDWYPEWDDADSRITEAPIRVYGVEEAAIRCLQCGLGAGYHRYSCSEFDETSLYIHDLVPTGGSVVGVDNFVIQFAHWLTTPAGKFEQMYAEHERRQH